MEYQDKLNILEAVLLKFGLSLEDKEIHDFFYLDRREFSYYEYNDDGKKYTFSNYFKPQLKDVSPLDFENSGYFYGHKTLIDWFMYENAGSNPLVWNNIGKPTFDVLDSFQKTRDMMGPVRQSLEGNLYNGEDANHRLLTLIINQFIETKAAITEEEKQKVKDKYTMTLEVASPISYELNNLLWKEMDKFKEGSSVKSIFPSLVREYRIKTFEHYRDAFYCVSYDEQQQLLTYDFNGEKFSGTEQELINWLKTKESKTEPIMTWEAEGFFYISCNNKVLKSKNKTEIEKMTSKVNKWLVNDKMELCSFLEVYDLDTKSYDIQFPSVYIEDKNEARYFADAVEYLLSEKKDVLLNKLQNIDSTEKWIKENIEKAFGYWGGFSLPDLLYKGLSKKEFDKLKPVMLELEEIMNYALNPELTNN